jgi:L-threonylcarbamoyladenylate synthase
LVLRKSPCFIDGSISIEEIEAVMCPKNTNTQRRSTIAPGMLSKHYAPQTKTILSEAITQDLILFDKKRVEC